MPFNEKPITDRIPLSVLVPKWSEEDLFPIPPTVTMYDSRNNNRPVVFQTYGHVSHGTKQYVLIANQAEGMSAVIELTEQGEMEIIFDQEAAQEIAEYMDYVELNREEKGVQIRDKYEPLVADNEYNIYRVSFAGRLEYNGKPYQVVAPADNASTIYMYRLELDSVGGENVLRPETDETAIRELFKKFFAMLDRNREAAHGQQTFDSFQSDDSDLFE